MRRAQDARTPDSGSEEEEEAESVALVSAEFCVQSLENRRTHSRSLTRFLKCANGTVRARLLAQGTGPYFYKTLACGWDYERVWRDVGMRRYEQAMTCLQYQLLVMFVFPRTGELLLSAQHAYLQPPAHKVARKRCNAAALLSLAQPLTPAEQRAMRDTHCVFVQNRFYVGTRNGFLEILNTARRWVKTAGRDSDFLMLPPTIVPVNELYWELDRAGLANDAGETFTPARRLDYRCLVELKQCSHAAFRGHPPPPPPAHALNLERSGAPVLVSRGALCAEPIVSELFRLRKFADEETALRRLFGRDTPHDVTESPETVFEQAPRPLDPFDTLVLTRYTECQADHFRVTREAAAELHAHTQRPLEACAASSGTPFPAVWCYPSRVLHSNGVVYVPTAHGKVPLCRFFNMGVLAQLLLSALDARSLDVPVQVVLSDETSPEWHYYQYDYLEERLRLVCVQALPQMDQNYERVYLSRLGRAPVVHNGRLTLPVRSETTDAGVFDHRSERHPLPPDQAFRDDELDLL